jgi:hypothetical protein
MGQALKADPGVPPGRSRYVRIERVNPVDRAYLSIVGRDRWRRHRRPRRGGRGIGLVPDDIGGLRPENRITMRAEPILLYYRYRHRYQLPPVAEDAEFGHQRLGRRRRPDKGKMSGAQFLLGKGSGNGISYDGGYRSSWVKILRLILGRHDERVLPDLLRVQHFRESQ